FPYTTLFRSDGGFELFDAGERLSVGAEQHGSAIEALACRVRILIDCGDHQARDFAAQAELSGDLRRQRNDLDAERLLDQPANGRARAFERRLLIRIEGLRGEFVLARAAADRHRKRAALAVAHNVELDPRAGRDVGDDPRQRLVGCHFLAVYPEHDVAGLKSGLLRGLAGLDRLDELAAIGLEAG